MSKVYSLSEGSYSVDHSKKFIPFDPTIHSKLDRKGSLFVEVQPFLIEIGNDLILLDTGLGYSNDKGEMWIHNNIRSLGFEPNDITMVLMSHLHFDHSGGIVKRQNGGIEMAFQQASYFVQEEELNYALTKDSSSYHKEIMECLRRYSGLELITGNGNINSKIEYELTGAHCPYHQVFRIKAHDETYFFGGDVMPEAMQVVHKMIAKYDFDGRKSMELREKFANDSIENNWKCLMYHDIKFPIVKFENFEDAIRIVK
ncbi:MAG: MBL fold metallo-hydrolase [bacterium]|jgi:glyoxylase-like metal-dependent hydrolase (beta-lactamase superfamily II)